MYRRFDIDILSVEGLNNLLLCAYSDISRFS